MIKKEIRLEDLDHHIQSYDGHLIYYFDQLVYGGKVNQVDYEKVNEGYLFNDQGCLHIYRDNILKGMQITYEPTDELVEEVQIGARNTNIEEVHIKRVLLYDEDGQAYYGVNLPFKLVLKHAKEVKQ